MAKPHAVDGRRRAPTRADTRGPEAEPDGSTEPSVWPARPTQMPMPHSRRMFGGPRPSVVLALALSGCAAAPLSPRAPAPGSARYTVESYNVECGKHRDSSIIEAIGAASADIVCLQETTREYETAIRRRWSARYPYQLYQHNEPNGGAAGLAMLSRYPLVDRGHHPPPYGWHPAWHVDVETPSGTIQILNVHLRAKLSGRKNELVALLTVPRDHWKEIRHFMRWSVPDKPTLVVGDFNEEPSGAAIDFLAARGYRDALSLFRPHEHTWRHPLLAWELRQTLDHVLFDRAFVPLNAHVIHAGRSDHLPVVAELGVAPDARWQPSEIE